MMLQGRLRPRQLKVTAYLIVLAMLTPLNGRAQDSNTTNPPPKSPEVQRLEEESARAKLRKDIAEANKAEFDARFPKPTSTPLAGTTTINDTAVIEGQMVGYVSMARAANRIVSVIKTDRTIETLAIYNERDVNLLLSYKVARGQVEALHQAFCDLICRQPPPPPPGTEAAPVAQRRALLSRINERVDGVLSATEQDKFFDPSATPAERNQILDKLNDRPSVDDAVAFLKAYGDQFDKFVTTIVQADAAVGVNPLTSYIRAENLRKVMHVPDDDRPSNTAYWLQLAVLNAGGNNRIKTNLIWDIFTGGNRLSHSGGAIVQYSLFNSEGQVVASDTITEYTNYIKSDKIKKLPCAEVDDFGKGDKVPECVVK